MAVRHRRRVQAGGDQAGDVGDVGHQQRARAVGDLAEAGEVDHPAVGGGAADDELRPVLERQALDLVVVDPLGRAVDAVGGDLEIAAGVGEPVAVGEMAAAGEVHAEQPVARAQQREVDRHVGAGARVRLDVGVLGAEQRLGPLDGRRLDAIDDLAAAVVAAPRVALGVLVGGDAAGRLEHGAAGEVLRGDQLEPFVLATALVGEGGVDLGVGRLQTAVGHAGVPSSLSTRRWWRPPSKGVSRKASRIASASAGATTREPTASTLASLWARARRAV